MDSKRDLEVGPINIWQRVHEEEDESKLWQLCQGPMCSVSYSGLETKTYVGGNFAQWHTNFSTPNTQTSFRITSVKNESLGNNINSHLNDTSPTTNFQSQMLDYLNTKSIPVQKSVVETPQPDLILQTSSLNYSHHICSKELLKVPDLNCPTLFVFTGVFLSCLDGLDTGATLPDFKY